MEFRILGPLDILEGGVSIPINAPKQRALLCLLLIHADTVLSIDQILADLWDGEEPPRSRKNLQFHVWKLRAALQPGGVPGDSVIKTTSPGYRLDVGDHSLDIRLFRDLVTRSKRATTLPDRADLLAAALSLWRGEPLVDVAYEEFAQHMIMRLRAERLDVLEDRIGTDLAIGRTEGLIPELEVLVDSHPTRERLSGQLMQALYGAGRQADALGVYQRLRALLGERGLEPCPDVVDLEERILSHDPALAHTGLGKPLAKVRSRAIGPAR